MSSIPDPQSTVPGSTPMSPSISCGQGNSKWLPHPLELDPDSHVQSSFSSTTNVSMRSPVEGIVLSPAEAPWLTRSEKITQSFTYMYVISS